MQEIQAHGLVYGISDRAVVDALLKSRVARAPAACSSSPTTTTPELQAQFTIFAWAKYITGRDPLPKFGNASAEFLTPRPPKV